MRTTIEIKDEHRAQLLEIAARRGEKGFSGLIREALDLYLDDLKRLEKARQRAQQARGALPPEEAAELRERTASLRTSWR